MASAPGIPGNEKDIVRRAGLETLEAALPSKGEGALAELIKRIRQELPQNPLD
jgi:hypothetical protein